MLSTGRKRSLGAFARMDLPKGQVVDILGTLKDDARSYNPKEVIL